MTNSLSFGPPAAPAHLPTTPRIQPVSLLTKRHRKGCVHLAPQSSQHCESRAHDRHGDHVVSAAGSAWPGQYQAASLPARRPRCSNLPLERSGDLGDPPSGRCSCSPSPRLLLCLDGARSSYLPTPAPHHRYRRAGQTPSNEQPSPGAGLQRRYLLPCESNGVGGPSPPTRLLSLEARPRGTWIKTEGYGTALEICYACVLSRV